MTSYAIELKGIDVTLGKRQVLKNVGFEVKPGQCLALLGPSGCGKTTLLRVVAGFIRPEKGSVHMFGREVVKEPPEKRPVNMLFQKPPLFDEKTVEENALFGVRRKDRFAAVQRVRDLAEIFDSLSFLKTTVGSLSGGERQRAAFIRAFANAREIMLLDEPIHSAFDLHHRRVLLTALKDCAQRQNLTMIVVTHEYDEAAYLSNDVLILTDGEASSGLLRDMYESPANLNIAHIFGHGNQVDASTIFDVNRRAQQCPVTIHGTLMNHTNAAWAFFRPDNVAVLPSGFGFIVASITFEGPFNRIVLRSVHQKTLIEAIVPESSHFNINQEVAAAISADKIMLFDRAGKRVN